jgi:hypothetical protein
MTTETLDMKALVARSADRAQAILLTLMKDQEPFEAMVATLLAVAVMAKCLGMPRETLQEGVGVAFDSLVEADPYVSH